MSGILMGVSTSSATGAAILDTQTTTAGVYGSAPDRLRGYLSSPSTGAISDGTSNLYSGAVIIGIYHSEGGPEYNEVVILSITGTLSNTGWAAMNAGGMKFNRTDASFTTYSGASHWTWSSPLGNPFGGVGTVRAVTFT